MAVTLPDTSSDTSAADEVGVTAQHQRLLVISPYAPYRDGIAAYAVQQVRQLRAEGHHVEVLSPDPSAAHHHLDLRNPREMAKLVSIAKGFDRLIVHFHPDFFMPQPATYQVRFTRFAALTAAMHRCPPATLVLHEIDERWGTSGDLTGRLARAMMQSFDQIAVHYSRQADQLHDAFGVDRSRIILAAHGQHFSSHSRLDRAGARERFGIDADAFVFLCIGFVAEHKGFDRAVRALGRLSLDESAAARVRLDVVGSPSTGNPAAAIYAEGLADLIEGTSGARLHQRYVSDAAFDAWLQAADVVLLPYRYIWSSSVVERAALFGCHIVASSVGGLDEQLAEIADARTVSDDAELMAAMASELVSAGVIAEAPSVIEGPWEVASDAGEVIAEVRHRAGLHRGYELASTPVGASGERAGDGGTGAGRSGDGRVGVGTGPGCDQGGGLRIDPRALAALRRIGPLARPMPVSGRPGVGVVKKLQRRLFDWELEPVIGWVDELRRATQRALESGSPESPPTDRK